MFEWGNVPEQRCLSSCPITTSYAVITIRTANFFITTAYQTNGAHERIRTVDLFLTKEVLYLLSYVGNQTVKQEQKPAC